MQAQLIEAGEKIHVMTRRGFPEDLQRHFVGTILVAQGSLVRVKGYTFVLSKNTLEYRRKPDVRTRIFDLGDARHIVNILPVEVEIEALHYKEINDRYYLTDDRSYRLDVNEFFANY
jgi:hypothetical protein